MAAPQQQSQPMEKSEMQKDIDHWTGRLNHAAANSHTVTDIQGDAPWSSGFFECFNPIDTCLMTWCCPCVTFGRTHHRLHKDANLAGYSAVNASCLGFWASMCCAGAHIIPLLMQRAELRNRSEPKLAGDFVTDCLKAWCCGCCDIVQQDKEACVLVAKEAQVITEAPVVKTEQMSYPPKA